MRERIWELDALRGLCILGMVVVHLVYDLVELYGTVSWAYPPFFRILMDWGGVLFLLLSGICVTLGRSPARRGIIVFLGGMACTAVTAAMGDKSLMIYFGVLHCLGVCMLLWPALKRLSSVSLTALGVLLILAGAILGRLHTDSMWLIPLGITPVSFASGDYFPLTGNLGWFMLGSVLGRRLYATRQTRFPGRGTGLWAVFLQKCGRLSLPIYLLHQPVICALLFFAAHFPH